MFRSTEWKTLTMKDREKMKLTFTSEGDFWMNLADFCKYFTNVDTCHFVNTSFFSLKKTWTESMLSGFWTNAAKGTSRDRCGGDINHVSHLENPQVGRA